ncbi:MAG TPA: secretin N-terminal domain-containing protein [Dissulfurispiraceae bacterium]|nr:secretin N-terminal domain-containing protein [Dissulfurispiraceae bacterium]
MSNKALLSLTLVVALSAFALELVPASAGMPVSKSPGDVNSMSAAPQPMPQAVQSGPNAPAGMPAPGVAAPQPAMPVAPSRSSGAPLPFTGQPIPGEAPKSVMPSPVAPTPAPSGAPVQTRMAPSMGGSSFFFDDADVFEVVQTVFGEVLRVNYVIDPQVKGRVNFRTTTPIPRDRILPIMEIILRLNGIAVVEEHGLYRIIPIGGISKEPAPIRFGKDPESIELKGTALMQIVPLTFINSSEMASILNPLLTQGGAIYDVTKKNVLIIADTDANIRRLLQVVAMFDMDTYKDATQPKVYVYALQNTKAEHVAKIIQEVMLGVAASSSGGVKTFTSGGMAQQQPAAGPNVPKAGPIQSQFPGSQSGESLVAPGTKVIADDVNNALVIYASPADYSIILGAIKQIDMTPRQVMIEAVVASVTLTDNLTLGLRWNLSINPKVQLDPFKRDIHLPGTLGFSPLPDLAAPNTSGSTYFSYTARDASGSVKLLIEADASHGKAKILSSPNILVADNREARIQVGSQIPIATSTTTTPVSATSNGSTVTTSNSTTSTVQYKDVGTILKVKPQVNDSGLISLELSQEVSSADTKSVLGTDQFVITKNEISTNLVAQDGETIVIGGLINESTNTSRSGIPGLSKIPLLGYLFGTTNDNVDRQELVILLTPRVLRNQTEAKKMTSDYYELFKNVGKEINLEKHKKTVPTNNEIKDTPAQSSNKTDAER